jgi:hypothetical protein
LPRSADGSTTLITRPSPRGSRDYSGADVAHLCEAAAELALEESLGTSNCRGQSPLRISKRAMKEVRPSIRALAGDGKESRPLRQRWRGIRRLFSSTSGLAGMRVNHDPRTWSRARVRKSR